jgi:hypothetical protein
MKRETAFWMALAIATVSAAFAIFAFTQPAVEPMPVTEPTPVTAPEPIVITIPVPPEETPAKFKVGDAVIVDGAPYAAKIVEVQGMAQWINRATGEEVVMRAYLVELTSPDGSETIQVRVPEIVITAK